MFASQGEAKYQRICDAISAFTAEHEHEPTVRELAEYSGIARA